MAPFDLDLRVRPDLHAPEAARRGVEASLRAELDDRTVDDAVLLVSELVTNSIRHGALASDDTIEVEVRRTGSSLHVEVADPGAGFDAAAVAEARSIGGWGLKLLDRIADRWGVARRGASRVWFELDLVSPRGGPGT